MRSDARKRLNESIERLEKPTLQHTQPHHDPAVCELIRAAQEKAWSEGYEARDDWFLLIDNPYRVTS